MSVAAPVEGIEGCPLLRIVVWHWKNWARNRNDEIRPECWNEMLQGSTRLVMHSFGGTGCQSVMRKEWGFWVGMRRAEMALMAEIVRSAVRCPGRVLAAAVSPR